MAAPKGNKFWQTRSSHRGCSTFADADQLWAACCKYFDWVTNNPLPAARLVVQRGEITIENLPRMRTMTIGEMCTFIGLAPRTWLNYREREGFVEVAARVDGIIRTHRSRGAAATGLLNPKINARELTSADGSEPSAESAEAQRHRIEMDAERFKRTIAGMATRSGA
jgi:hypothetical protein